MSIRVYSVFWIKAINQDLIVRLDDRIHTDIEMNKFVERNNA